MFCEVKYFRPLSFDNAIRVLLVSLVFGLLPSCTKKSDDAKASQSIVRVNGDEITVLQLNNELKRANVQAAQQAEAEKQITQKLVDRQMLVQEALKVKLDRNPRVMQAIENAKMQLLAQAYLENKVSAIAKPTKAEIENYRVKHAEIFANRKIFVLEELIFKIEAGYTEELNVLSNSAKTIEDVTQWLDERLIKFDRTQAQHASETLPPDLLAKLSKMVEGDVIFINANGRTAAGRLVDVTSAPIAKSDATPIIERILTNQKHQQTAESEIARLRRAAKVEYINQKFKPAETTKPSEKDKSTNHIEKGLSGL
ncbi:MAG: peptidyl-prolyl cis-trans isomerase, EpsD family [Methylotenera sp.]|uniref:EpsD family peptidyl-prolyl cis-trans isomerase n=1 Tax=Methylotenera sp. TaxID=2051956 RepID=UPI0017BD2301|nr:EpsD family peptidyl-prolyl cis-trans isomerase [Methylotenera sp.]NOU25206.1 peptidyl-prolyl cis-trans isomerase, EpsD family [Methylotenera sp.]